MPSPQLTGAAVPLDQQSVLPSVRGVPWWGAVLLATGLTALGAIIDAYRIGDLGGGYKFLYLVGCVAAALAVRRRGLFTAAAQPPLVAFAVSVVALYRMNSDQASANPRSFVFKVMLPIAANFPWMATVFVITLALVVLRWYLTRDKTDDRRRDRSKSPRSDSGKKTSDSTVDAAANRDDKSNAEKQRPRRERSAKPSTTQRSRSQTRPARPKQTKPQAAANAEAATAQPIPEASTVARRPKRVTAGQVLRAEAGAQIAANADGSDGTNPPARPSVATDFAPYESVTERPAGEYPSTRSRNRG
uniref:DUF6542 domain-containing protein n=1 Tax=Gordonia sp. B7-2 TaxID=3420932 RepID=UPI003D8FA662